MYELKVTVKKVMGVCTADPPMKPGDYFTVSDGDIQVEEGGYICLWALQSLIPLLTPKERNISEQHDEDWMWRVHHAQCPDPDGRVIFSIERTGTVAKDAESPARGRILPERVCEKADALPSRDREEAVDAVRTGPLPHGRGSERSSQTRSKTEGDGDAGGSEGGLQDLRVEVESVQGRCTSRMKQGNCFTLRSGRLYIPTGCHFCLYALQATLPLLPAKQRALQDGDWLKNDCRVHCPDPAGRVILRIDGQK